MKKAKRKSWQDYISKINSSTPVASVWSKIRKLTGKFIPKPLPALLIDNALNSNSIEVAEVLSEHFSKVSSSSNYSETFQHQAARTEYPDFSSNNDEFYNAPFLKKELYYALSKTSNTSPGEDSIQAKMVQKLPPETLELLLKIYNKIWSTGVIPVSWNSSIIVPVAKPGKDPQIATSYRPIALTSVLCKIFERMVNLRLVYYMESNELISAGQFGFRKNISCLDPLLRLSTYIQDGFVQGKHTIGVFFDIEKAYDMTWRKGILLEMFNLGLRGNLPNFIKSFLNNRNLKVRVGSSFSSPKSQEEGVPQGSVLSVMLFLIHINSIINYIHLTEPSVMCSLYADDLAIYFCSSDLTTTASKIQNAVNAAIEWTELHGFRFSVAKTVAVHFSSRFQRVNVPPNIVMGNEILVYEPVARFLGLFFDSHLTWNHHLKLTKTKAIRSLNILKVVSGYDWGADQQTLLKLYNSLCKSKINYGCQIYSSACKTNLRMLDVVHNRALRICTGVYRTSPIESIYVTAWEKPLDLQREFLSFNFILKTKAFPESSSFNILNNFSFDRLYTLKPRSPQPLHVRMKPNIEESNLNEVMIHQCRPFRVPPWLVPTIDTCLLDIKKSFHSAPCIQSLFLDHMPKHEDSVCIYTDGSKSDDAVGCAAIINDTEYSAKLSKQNSSFSAELIAILLILKNILYNSNFNNFTIFSDSKSALSAIKSFYPNNSLILDIQFYLTRLTNSGKRISFCWSPGHVGIQGNEDADRAAKEAAKRDEVNYRPVPFLDLRTFSRSFTTGRFQRLWSDLATNLKLKSIKPNIKPWPRVNASRRDVRVLNRLRIGHTHLTHNYLLSTPQIPPVCDKCQALLSVKHILIECPDLTPYRVKWDFPGSLVELLDENVNIFNLTSFLKKIDLYYKI